MQKSEVDWKKFNRIIKSKRYNVFSKEFQNNLDLLDSIATDRKYKGKKSFWNYLPSN